MTSHSSITSMSTKFTNLVGKARRRPPSAPWYTLPQPVPLVKIASQTSTHSDGCSNTRYIANGITPEAQNILSQLPAPLYIVAFTGFGRSGKSYTASKLREHLTGDNKHQFADAPGNVPCTHGIDMMVFKHPTKDGHFVFLDCEGGANHNQTALPFVIGLAARLATSLYVFERGCFTTNGLDTVMQIINMGMATSQEDDVDITRSLTLCENMSFNQGIQGTQLITDLLNETSGDETTNRVRRLVKQRFDVEFAKIPFNTPGYTTQSYDQACSELAATLGEFTEPFSVGNVPVDGTMVLQLASELLAQIRSGGNRYNMVSATEALVGNMAMEAANTMWSDFIHKARKAGLHPQQVNGRKHLRTMLREVEGISNMCLNELESFTSKLVPAEPASVAKEIWDRNYKNFVTDITTSYNRKASDIARYSAWTDRINRFVTELLQQVLHAIRQLLRFAKFSTTLILMSNYYLWRQSYNLVTGLASSLVTAG